LVGPADTGDDSDTAAEIPRLKRFRPLSLHLH
jgi:hypothetical protein